MLCFHGANVSKQNCAHPHLQKHQLTSYLLRPILVSSVLYKQIRTSTAALQLFQPTGCYSRSISRDTGYRPRLELEYRLLKAPATGKYSICSRHLQWRLSACPPTLHLSLHTHDTATPHCLPKPRSCLLWVLCPKQSQRRQTP